MEETLPYAWYVDPEILRQEQERIFRSAWQYAGHAGEAPEPGTFFTTQAGRTPVVVTRARDGELRAFLNVCRHRGFPLAEGSGKRETLQCPYHAWTYALDGSLRSAPRSEELADFAECDLGLRPVALDTWGPFVFVNAGRDPEPLSAALGSMPAQVAELGLDVDDLVFYTRWQTDVEANWKVVCENFLECYHCAVAHPSFSKAIDVAPDAYLLEEHPTFSSQYGPPKNGGGGLYDAVGEVTRGQFHLLFPGTVINVMPGRGNVSIGPIVPLTAERTYRFLDYFFAPGMDEQWIADYLELDTQVGAEDRVLVERVQLGMRSGLIAEGALMPRSERLIAHFERQLVAALGGDTNA
jgi:phenylpropionate dioxygenase-like ring-hydroxylating dioxygenase large terminal subunit